MQETEFTEQSREKVWVIHFWVVHFSSFVFRNGKNLEPTHLFLTVCLGPTTAPVLAQLQHLAGWAAHGLGRLDKAAPVGPVRLLPSYPRAKRPSINPHPSPAARGFSVMMEQDTPDTHLTPMPITDLEPKSYSSHSRLGYAHWALNGLKRSFCVISTALLLGLSTQASARTIKIIEAQNLELRNVIVTDELGRKETQEFVIISGPRVELKLDKSSVVAQRIEFNKTRRTLTLVGKGIYTSVTTGKDNRESTQTLEGFDLVVGVADEGVQGEDVLISTTALDIIGQQIQRIPGQINVDGGYFTTCAKCGRNPNDYAFRARNLVIYPGDRLIAYDAQVLLADEPIFYFPLLVMFLGEERFQPKISIGKNDLDGLTFSVGLPFVVGDQSFGFSTLNFYQNRDPAFGFETKYKAYDLFSDFLGATNTLNFAAKLEPKPLLGPGKYVDDLGGYLYDYSLNWQGRWVTLTDQGLKFSLDVKRGDSKSDVTLQKITSTEFKVQTSLPDFDFEATYSDRYLHNEDKKPVTKPGQDDGTVAEPQNVLKKPEVVFDLKPWKDIWEVPNLNADFKFTLGNYHAPTNEGNREALKEAALDPKNQRPFSDASRLKAEYSVDYNRNLWTGATFKFNNTYIGQFYSNGDRSVNVSLSSSLNQTWERNTFALTYDFARIEGLSPFAFDAPPLRSSNKQTFSASANLSPLEGIGLTGNQAYDLLEKDPQKQKAAQFGVNLKLGSIWKALPIGITYSVDRNFFREGGEPWGFLERWSASSDYNQAPLSLSIGTSWQASTSIVNPGNFQPLALQATLSEPASQNRLNLSINRDLNKDEWTTGGLEFQGNQKPEISTDPAWQFITKETYVFNNPRISGSASASFGNSANKTTLNLNHDFLLKDTRTESEDALEGKGTFRINLTNSQTLSERASSSFSLDFGGSDYDLAQDAWNNPSLSTSYSINDYRQNFKASLEASAPGIADAEWRFKSIAITGGQEIIQDRLAVQIGVNYNRSLINQQIQESLLLTTLRMVVALGEVEKPAAYIEASLPYTLRGIDGNYNINKDPLLPTFTLLIDRCCWALRGELNLSKGSIKFSWIIPSSKSKSGTSLLEVDKDKTRSILDVLSEAKP
jgi:hypothetical protein